MQRVTHRWVLLSASRQPRSRWRACVASCARRPVADAAVASPLVDPPVHRVIVSKFGQNFRRETFRQPQRAVLLEFVRGAPPSAIAEALQLQPRTVRRYLTDARRRLDAANESHLGCERSLSVR